MVTEIGINKVGSFFQHESLAVWIVDKEDSKEYTFVIERTPSRQLGTPFLSRSPTSKKILQSILSAIRNMKPTNREGDTIPLLPLTSKSSDSEPDFVPTPIYIPRMSLVDSLTSRLAGVAAAVSLASQSSITVTNDQISGVAYLDRKQCIKRFKPNGLSLFDLVVLALVVHEEALFCSLF